MIEINNHLLLDLTIDSYYFLNIVMTVISVWDNEIYHFFRIVTKNKKKKEREEALKSRKATGARKKESQKGEEIKVISYVHIFDI